MIEEGAWWDFVDDIAIRLIGMVLLDDRERMSPQLDRWIDDPHMWIRRAAIISQIKHRTVLASEDHRQGCVFDAEAD
jgi:3-methyladenine DNA glycosylase AlkD